jgi:hypothetical protein
MREPAMAREPRLMREPAQGREPHRERELCRIVGRLRQYYSAAEVRTWLYACHPQLAGERAIDLINQNRSEEVLRVIDRLDAEVYL